MTVRGTGGQFLTFLSLEAACDCTEDRCLIYNFFSVWIGGWAEVAWHIILKDGVQS